jgi:hypothetical protein
MKEVSCIIFSFFLDSFTGSTLTVGKVLSAWDLTIKEKFLPKKRRWKVRNKAELGIRHGSLKDIA